MRCSVCKATSDDGVLMHEPGCAGETVEQRRGAGPCQVCVALETSGTVGVECSVCTSFVCRLCQRRVPWSFGCDDDFPHLCDDCWSKVQPVDACHAKAVR